MCIFMNLRQVNIQGKVYESFKILMVIYVIKMYSMIHIYYRRFWNVYYLSMVSSNVWTSIWYVQCNNDNWIIELIQFHDFFFSLVLVLVSLVLIWVVHGQFFSDVKTSLATSLVVHVCNITLFNPRWSKH